MYCIVAVCIFFVSILRSYELKSSSPAEEKIEVTVYKETATGFNRRIEKIDAFSGYWNKNSYYTPSNHSKKIVKLIPSRKIIENIVKDIQAKARYFQSTLFILHDMKCLSVSEEHLIESLTYNKKDLRLYAQEMKYVLNMSLSNCIILTEYSSELSTAIRALSIIEYSGLVVVQCRDKEEMKTTLGQKKEKSLYPPIVAIPVLTPATLLTIGYSYKPKVYMEVTVPKLQRDSMGVIAMLMLIGFIGIVASILYLIATRREVRPQQPKTVKVTQLETLPSVPYLRLASSLASPEQDCVICFEPFTQTAICRVLPCNHFYHAECIDVWLIKYSNRCPYCQTQIQESVPEAGP